MKRAFLLAICVASCSTGRQLMLIPGAAGSAGGPSGGFGVAGAGGSGGRSGGPAGTGGIGASGGGAGAPASGGTAGQSAGGGGAGSAGRGPGGMGGLAATGGAGGRSATGGSGGSAVPGCSADADCKSGAFCNAGVCCARASAIAAGTNHACVAVSDGVRCWGANNAGQLGFRGTGGRNPLPVAVPGLTRPAVALAAGGDASCALLSDGSVWCWGDDSSRQLGVFSPATLPVQVPLNGAATAIAMGLKTGYAVVNGAVWAWGGNMYGQLGTPTLSSLSDPIEVPGITAASAVAGGDFFGCALASSQVWCWGGDSQTTRPAQVDTAITAPILAIGAGWGVRCSLTSTQAVCTGGLTNVFSFPSTATALAVGRIEACGVDGTNTVACWGAAGDPLLATAALPSKATAVASGDSFSCALAQNGSAWCWGHDDLGQLGDGGSGPADKVVQVSPW